MIELVSLLWCDARSTNKNLEATGKDCLSKRVETCSQQTSDCGFSCEITTIILSNTWRIGDVMVTMEIHTIATERVQKTP
jgi:hypothetical protein